MTINASNKRTYTATHPWITFAIDLRRMSWKFWVRLGECQSKCEHIRDVPLRPSTSKELHKVYLAKGVRASAAIEGNTLREDEVREHLEGRLQLPASREYLAREVDNIIRVCNAVLGRVRSNRPLDLTAARIKAINRIVLKNTPYDDGLVPGRIPERVIGVGHYRGAPREDCTYLLERLGEWIESPEMRDAQPRFKIAFAIIRAVLAHLYIEWIHPFGDGNGRTGRLVEFQILIASGVPAPAAHLLSNHYNLTRSEYYRQLDAASRSGGDVSQFLEYAVEGFLDGLCEQLEHIWNQQWDIAWRNFIHEHHAFRDMSTKVARRRRGLLLDLSQVHEPVPFSEISSVSPRVAQLYARLTERTLDRDIKELVAMGFVEKTKRGYRARKELILSFRPPAADATSVPL